MTLSHSSLAFISDKQGPLHLPNFDKALSRRNRGAPFRGPDINSQVQNAYANKAREDDPLAAGATRGAARLCCVRRKSCVCPEPTSKFTDPDTHSYWTSLATRSLAWAKVGSLNALYHFARALRRARTSHSSPFPPVLIFLTITTGIAREYFCEYHAQLDPTNTRAYAVSYSNNGRHIDFLILIALGHGPSITVAR